MTYLSKKVNNIEKGFHFKEYIMDIWIQFETGLDVD